MKPKKTTPKKMTLKETQRGLALDLLEAAYSAQCLMWMGAWTAEDMMAWHTHLGTSLAALKSCRKPETLIEKFGGSLDKYTSKVLQKRIVDGEVLGTLH